MTDHSLSLEGIEDAITQLRDTIEGKGLSHQLKLIEHNLAFVNTNLMSIALSLEGILALMPKEQ